MIFHNVFPMKIRKSSSVANDLADDVITVHNFFSHWIKELHIKRYGDDLPTSSLTNIVEIYKYSDAILKPMEGDALKTIRNGLLYSNKSLVFQLLEHDENITRPKMLTRLTEQMTILKIDLTNFLINFRMNIIT